MIFKMPKVSFFLRSDNNKKRTHSIYCRITHNRTTAEFSTGEKLYLKEWNQKAQKMKGHSPKARYIKTLTETIAYNIKTFALSNEAISARELLQLYKQSSALEPILLELVDSYISAVQNKVKEGTIRNHQIKRQNLKDYQDYRGIVFYPQNFTSPEADKFKTWFMDRAQTNNVTSACRNVLFYKNCLETALKKGEIKPFPLLHYKGEKDPLRETIFLTMKELDKLDKFYPENKQLRQAKDLFLFQCYTGISFGDIWGNWEIKQHDNEFIIFGTRNKNGQRFYVPLSEQALSILEKYEMKLPKYCNAPYNRILKELAMLCGIDKRITSHTARKTFATVQDALGWSRESIAKMLGHKSLATTENYYLGECEVRILEEMKKAG